MILMKFHLKITSRTRIALLRDWDAMGAMEQNENRKKA
jgi:hypothetical protein